MVDAIDGSIFRIRILILDLLESSLELAVSEVEFVGGEVGLPVVGNKVHKLIISAEQGVLSDVIDANQGCENSNC